MGKMGTRNSRSMHEAPSVDEGPDADIESPRSPRDNCMSSCENSLDERGSKKGSFLRILRGRRARNKSQGSEGMMSDACSLESSFNCAAERSEGIDGLLLKTKFTRAELQRMYRGFKNDCPEGYADKEAFKKIYAQFFPHGDSGQYAGLVFNAFDLSRRGKLSFENFILRLSTALHGTTEDKLRWMFHIYDVDGDGIISKPDLNAVVSAVHNLIGSSGPNENHAINNQVRRIFEILDKSDSGCVTQDIFIGTCANDECISQSLAMFDSKR
ncbi:neuronal calcium sensor 1-like [Dendronephthya gigantea]|uniref:neuronal calcium sensor 1-like n=1 Tax=Dendronephthya gigantea TaxID=151771 RepID=UPI001069D2F0|nr:neuronal calcium sensor 1-like [Dendronephthya gigantea]